MKKLYIVRREEMKSYIVYIRGEEQPALIKAGNYNSAKKKAKKKYSQASPTEVQVVYTEV